MEQRIIQRLNELKQHLELIKENHKMEIVKHHKKRNSQLLFFFYKEESVYKFAIQQLEMLLTNDVKPVTNKL